MRLSCLLLFTISGRLHVKLLCLSIYQVEWRLLLRDKILFSIVTKAKLRWLRLLLIKKQFVGINASTLTLFWKQAQSLLVRRLVASGRWIASLTYDSAAICCCVPLIFGYWMWLNSRDLLNTFSNWSMALIEWRCCLHLVSFHHHQRCLLIQNHSMFTRGNFVWFTQSLSMVIGVRCICCQRWIIINRLKLLIRWKYALSFQLLANEWWSVRIAPAIFCNHFECVHSEASSACRGKLLKLQIWLRAQLTLKRANVVQGLRAGISKWWSRLLLLFKSFMLHHCSL